MRRTLTTAAVAVLAVVGLAAPASADHYTSADPSGCYSGQLASGTGQALYTDKVKIKTSKSGAETWTCKFSDVEASTAEENGYVDWAPPSEVTRYTSSDNCWAFGDGGGTDLVAVGDAEFKVQPSGKITIECTLVPTRS